MTKTTITRRRFIQWAGLGSLGLAAGGTALRRLTPAQAAGSAAHDVEINLTAAPAQQAILSGATTTVWKYTAALVKGDAANLVTLPNTYLGPAIHLRAGQRVRINFNNNIGEESIVHWHGLHVPHEADGHPSYVINDGESYVYEFDVLDRAGTYWYHPHPHGRTGPQAYMGLAGLFYISDGAEDLAGLPTGSYDLPLVIQDRTFDAGNQLVYSTSNAGFLGDQILINGQPNTTPLSVEALPYRLRLLNGSNSRIYKLAWADGTPLSVIAADGGLLEKAVSRNYLMLAPGERAELLVDFSQWTVGNTVTLKSLAYSGAAGSNATLPPGSEFTVADFQITAATTTPTTPTVYKSYLPIITGDGATPPPPAGVTRSFQLYMQQGTWTIDGRTFETTNVVNEEIVTLGDREIWEFDNNSPFGGGGGGNNGQPHPMHIHGLQFRIVSRTPPSNSTQYNNWLTVKDGYVDDGWQDTILLMPGEKVQVDVTFKDYTGLFLYHCHNLEHEDMGMMRNYRVDL